MEQFTNLYQLSKTLKFKLEPEGNTKTTFEKWVNEMNSTSEDSNLFAKDEKIRDAYLVIKPIMDKLHEQFIEKSLTSDEAKHIDFSEFLAEFRDKKKRRSKKIQKIEERLRKDIGATYNVGGRFFSAEIEKAVEKLKEEKNNGEESEKKSKDEETDNKRKKTPYDCLTEKKIFSYLCANAKTLAKENGITERILNKHLEQFKKFWGYLDGYNQNRENYYEVKEEAATAVATRIVHENLPTFCSNALRFEKHREEYLGIYQFLKDNNCEAKIKNSQGKEVEAEAITETCFLIGHFNNCLAQSQIEEYNRIIGNYNYLINLYNQAPHDEKDFKKIDEFEKLKKQIGCGKKKTMFAALIKDKQNELTDEQKKKENKEGDILTVETLLNRAKDAGDVMFVKDDNKDNDKAEIITIPDFIQFLEGCDNWDGIYMSKAAINKISNRYFANWHSIVDLFIEIYNGKDKELKEKINACITYDKKREEPLKLRDAVELSGFFAVLDKVKSEHFFKEWLFKEDNTNEYCGDKALSPSKNLIKLLCHDMKYYTEEVFLKKSSEIVALKKYKDEKTQAGKEDENIKKIKEWFDAAADAMSIVRFFAVRRSKMKGSLPNVTMEQALSNLLYSEDIQWFKWRDLIRNYLTKKPQDDVKENKLKLNFGNPTLMKGWDLNKEPDNTTVILRKNDWYYLGIMNKEYNHILDNVKTSSNGECYEKMDYKQISLSSGVGGFVRKCFSSAQEYGWHCPDNCLNEDGKIIIKDDEAQPHLKAIIDCYKDFFDKYKKDGFEYKDYNFNFLESNEYEKLSDFFRDVEQQGYKISFRKVSVNYIDNLVKEGKLYLFKIYSKDFSTGKDGGNGSTGNENLHTKYWKRLFDENNLKDVVYKLNGKSEIFMRKPIAKEARIKHKKGSKLVNKRDINGEIIPEHIYKEIYSYVNNNTKISKEAKIYIDEKKAIIKDAKHEIVKDNRFYGETNSYFFHCPITINFKAKKYKEPQYAYPEVNAKITDALQQSDNLQFIGIDRGEKHLVYSCTIDKNGKIVKDKNNEWKCHHHDIITVIRKDKDGKIVEHKTNYVQKLEAVAGERIIAKKNWQAQRKIKDLRNGYISHVVHRLVEEVIKEDNKRIAPHAYIVLEDLSTEMKRGRQKFEKQVYQNLEVALAKKLNFVVDKEAEQGELGSVSKALQLTPPISNYQDIEGKKQFGIMLYTRANYTSITDPATGWRKTIYIRNGKEEDIKKQILDKFNDFGLEGKDYFFEYREANAGRIWRMYSGKNGEPLTRFRNKREKLTDKNVWVTEPINVVEILDKLFADFDKTKSFKKQIEDDGIELKKIEGRSETAWQSLRYVLDMIQQIRNSGIEKKDDNFLHSPVRGENGEHFDTRNHENNGELSAIKDADANGAYNIARKGLIMNAHYRYWVNQGRPEIKKGKTALSLYVSDAEWDMWLLDKEKWHEHLCEFALRTK